MIKIRNLFKSGKNRFRSILFLSIISSLVFSVPGCENNPNDLGLSYISPLDTLNKKVLNSRIDTMLITSTNTLKYINTSTSQNLFVGKYQNYESRGLLKFTYFPSGYDTFTVVSAKLKIRYNKNYFKDSLGVTSFNIYKLNRFVDLSQVTYDSITSSDIGNTSLGTYSGTPVDTSLITIPFNTQIISEWIKSANDTSVYKNYGVIFMPDFNSTTIKSFYSTASITGDFGPIIMLVLTNGTKTDTVSLNLSSTTSISDAPTSIIPNERILLQSGLSYRGSLKFDLSKLPSNVIINEAYLEFKYDPANSFFLSNSSDKRIAFSMLTDTTLQNSDNLFYYASLIDSVTYSVRLNSIFQRWNSGTAVNYGVQLKNVNDVTEFDKIALYSPLASDVSKRPYLRIFYTIRN
ncbi:MAG TPA: hypothetical protein VIL99_07175 [Ignavibacteria bacterium]